MSAPPSLTTRLASLADSVFGVAMTLLAYDITVPDTGDTGDVVRSLAPKVYALALSFAVAAMYWLNQQRRLSHYHRMDTEVHGVVGEFVLLFAVIMLPITTRSFVQGHTMLLYVLVGVCCGIAAVMIIARTTTGSATHGQLWELDAIAAVVIGGTLLTGGRGTIVGTVLGVLIFTTLSNVFTLNNLDTSAQAVAKCLIIVAAVLLQQQFAQRNAP